MKMPAVVALCLVGSLAAGCTEDTKTTADQRLDTELVRTINNIEVENAILAQHTLYPYHFVLEGERLNELGQRDLDVLARHFLEYPGILNIRRGEGTTAERYQARVAYVTNRLKEAGVEPGRVTLLDGIPGGSGLASEQVVTILKKTSDPAPRLALRGTITR